MSRYIVDASIAIKWYLPEIHDAAARRLLTDDHELVVPDLIYSEVGNILWKRVRSGEILEDEAHTVMASFRALSLSVGQSRPLAESALIIACQAQRTVYDSMYLALAVRENAAMVTVDQKFYNAIKATPLSPYVLWVEDIP